MNNENTRREGSAARRRALFPAQLIISTCVSFVGLALNYGFQSGFAVRWRKAAARSYVVIVPMLMVVIPPMQRFVMRQAGCRRAEVRLPHKKKTPAQAGTANSSFERNTRLAT